MTSMTITARSETFDTFAMPRYDGAFPATIQYRSHDDWTNYMAYPDADERVTFDSIVGRARRIYNEAVRENDHRNAIVPPITLAPVDPAVDILQREINTLRATIRQLSEPITEGSDERLAEFWQLAADTANNEGFCPEYDRIARAMGGTAREHTFYVDMVVSVSVQVEVQASSNEEARDRARDIDLSEIDELVRNNVDIQSHHDIQITGSYRE